MGIYLNPNYENFRQIIAAEIYVDKTMMIKSFNRYIDKGNKYICMSRPRRFGKTIAGNMLSSYYSKGCDSKELFAPLKIASDPCFLEKLNKYNVIKIDLNSEYQNTENKANLIKRLTEKIKREMRRVFPTIDIAEDDSLADTILNIYSETGETFIIIIDEYDVLVRERVDQQLFEKYLSFLNGLFKSDTLRSAISLAYLTGILPIIRDKVQSKLNNFREYTIIDAYDLAEYIGFIPEEVRSLCEKYKVDYDECMHWYDGYSQRGYEIYNPESVVMCMETGSFESFWGKTSTYEAIAERIRMNFEGTKEAVIQMLSGENVDVNVTRYTNTMDDFSTKDDMFTYLIHIGYLAYDTEKKTCRIPNKEVRQEWLNAIEGNDNYRTTNQIIAESKTLLQETLNGNEEAVAKALDKSHIHVTSNRSYNNEDCLQSAIYLAYIYALNDYTAVREMTAGKGFADVVYIPVHSGNTAMIIELKRNDSTESAITQIREKQYFDCLSHYEGNLLFVGINYDEKAKTHSCEIERFIK
ncbi:MAG: AAA family ATPase [Lachnospiraceae bacterium]|nr:AAA family ATPase [Lachnospiraceae bacterium]